MIICGGLDESEEEEAQSVREFERIVKTSEEEESGLKRKYESTGIARMVPGLDGIYQVQHQNCWKLVK